MFLVERIIGLGIFVSVLCFVCLLISVEKYNYKKVLFVYILALAIMAFYHVPDETADIYRIYNWMGSDFKYLNFAGILERYSDSSTFLATLYYWLFSKTGEFRLLPATTVAIVYSCIFYIIAKTADIYDIKRKYIVISLIFIMSTDSFMSAASGIRSMLACSLVGFCFFRECVEKKFRLFHILLYLIAALVHNFAVIIIIIRLLIPLFNKNKRLLKKMLYLGIVIIFGIGISQNASGLIEDVFNKADSYINDGKYVYLWGYVTAALIAFIIFISMIRKNNKVSVNLKELSQIKIITLVFLTIAISLCTVFSIFTRLNTHIAPIVYLPYLMISLNNNAGTKRNGYVVFLCFMTFMIVCARGYLCSLKFF